MNVLFFGNTNVGCKRECNEDYFKISESMRMAIVCDGMGGHESGDVASRLVAETIMDVYPRLSDKQMQKLSEDYQKDIPVTAKKLYLSAQLTNYFLQKYIKEHKIKKGMGTTLVAVQFFKGYALILHVGDSRCYRFRNGKLVCLTKDHSFAQALYDEGSIDEAQLEGYEQKNIITRAFGMDEQLKVDLKIEKVEENDIFLLCSDGLWGKVADNLLADRIRNNLDNMEELPDVLIRDAINEGGDDNVTAVVAKSVPTGAVQEEMIPCELTLTVSSPDVESRYQSVLNELFNGKWTIRRLFFLIIIVLILGIGGYFIRYFFRQDSGALEPFLQPPLEAEQKQKQWVHFLLDDGDNTALKMGQVIVDSIPCGTLAELEQGRLFEIGHHKFLIKIDSITVYSGEFECVIDPLGTDNLVNINTK